MHFSSACWGSFCHSSLVIQNLSCELMMSARTDAPENTTCFLCGELSTLSFSLWSPSSFPCMFYYYCDTVQSVPETALAYTTSSQVLQAWQQNA